MVSVEPVVANRAVVDWASWLTNPVVTGHVVVVLISLGAAPRTIAVSKCDAGVVHSPLVSKKGRFCNQIHLVHEFVFQFT